MFRESQENGLVNFRGGGGARVVKFDAAETCRGGAAHGTDGRTPESPCKEDLVDLWGKFGLDPS